MRVTMGPWPGGVNVAIGDGAAATESLRDAMGFVGEPAGSLGWVHQSQQIASFGVNTPRRAASWLTGYVQLESAPTSEVYHDDVATQTKLYDGKAYHVTYDDKLVLALNNGAADAARVYPDPDDLNLYCYLSNNQGEGWVNGVSGSGPYTITFTSTGAKPQPARVAGSTVVPRYVMLQRDSAKGAKTARLYTVPAGGYSFSADDLVSVNVDVDPEADGALTSDERVRVYWGEPAAADTDFLMTPTQFFVYRDRLGCVWQDKLWFAGYPGRGDVAPTAAPVDPLDWAYWDGLNFIAVGNPARGAIQRVEQVGEALLVVREQQTCVVFGYVPVDAALDNQLQWRVVSDEVGIEGYGALALSRDGQSAFLVGSKGWYVYSGGQMQQVDSPIRRHHRYRSGYTMAAAAGDFVAVMDPGDHPELVAIEDKKRPAGILNQFPVVWLFYMPTQAWWPVVRATMNDLRHIVPFDAPTWGGGIVGVEHNGQSKLAIGHAGGLWTLNDPDVTDPAIDDCHIQAATTHAADTKADLMQFVGAVVHARQPFDGVEAFATCPADGFNAGPGKDVSARSPSRRTAGDLAVYEVYAKESPLTPRISLSLGYFGDALLAGQNGNKSAYNTLTASAQAVSQKLYIDGRVDRVDVYASAVTTFDVVIYDVDDDGLPDASSEVRRFTVTAPKGGMKSVATPHWYSVEFGKGGWAPTAGYYHVGVIGAATFRTFLSASTLYNADKTVAAANAALALRVVQEVGGPMVVKEATNAMANAMTVMGAAH